MQEGGGQNDTQRWTKWHESGQFGRDGGGGTEIAVFRVKTFKSEPAKASRLLQSSNYSYRPQTTKDCLTWVFGIKNKMTKPANLGD